MTTKVLTLDELRQGLDGILESCSEPGQTVVVELPNQRRVTIQNWDADDDLIDRLLESNADFCEMAAPSLEDVRSVFSSIKGSMDDAINELRGESAT